MNNEFGQYLSTLRSENAVTLRQLSTSVNVSPTYLSDVENGRRLPFNAERQRIIANMLMLTDSQRYKFFDLASQGREEIPTDITEYINANPIIKELIRKAASNQLSKDFWKQIMESMQEKK